MTLATFKEAHLAKAASRWDDAVKDARRFLTYNRRDYKGFHATEETDAEDAMVREFTRLLFSCTGSTRYYAFGGLASGFGLKMNGYDSEVPYDDPCALMEFVRFFVGHELLDDGDPGVGYFRSTVGDKERTHHTFVLCDESHPKAQPYFHRSLEMLRKEYPKAKPLTIDRALEILKFYENQQAKSIRRFRTDVKKYGEEAFVTMPEVEQMEAHDKASRFTALADAILAGE